MSDPVFFHASTSDEAVAAATIHEAALTDARSKATHLVGQTLGRYREFTHVNLVGVQGFAPPHRVRVELVHVNDANRVTAEYTLGRFKAGDPWHDAWEVFAAGQGSWASVYVSDDGTVVDPAWDLDESEGQDWE